MCFSTEIARRFDRDASAASFLYRYIIMFSIGDEGGREGERNYIFRVHK